MSSHVDAPTVSDRFVRRVSHRIGGPLGRHASPRTFWPNAALVAMVVATVVYLLGASRSCPAGSPAPRRAPDQFKLMCYSDIGLLYRGRGLLPGNALTWTAATIRCWSIRC